MTSYLSISEIYEENKVLKEKIIELEKKIQKLNTKNRQLNEKIDAQNEEISNEILEYFHSIYSIRRTAWKYDMELQDLFTMIPQWDGGREGLRSASDYEECLVEVMGRYEYDDEQEYDMSKEELERRMRMPEPDEIKKIIADYKESTHLSLYELADRYDLKINNLFRLLKENGVIEKEIDAKYYESFYVDHLGAGSEWDGKSELGLIEAFYEEIKPK